MKMIFKELYLFSPQEKKAKKVEFAEGLNIVTSSQEDGTNKGKSVVMRSLYHALGAESLFEAKWNKKEKVYILKFEVDDKSYYIYRSDSLYKIFDGDRQLIAMATRSSKLAEELKKITGFAVMLPNKVTDKLEITPPVYNYLPYFLDQDEHDGSNFASFANLAQYANYKENVLFYHFGVYDDEYFSVVQRKEKCEETINGISKRKELVEALIEDVDEKIGGKAYSSDLKALEQDVSRYKREYSDTIKKLNKSKATLVELRNNLFDLNEALNETISFEKKNEKEIKTLHQHICPECGSKIENVISIKSKRYNLSDDIIIIKNDIQLSILEAEAKISAEEERYKEYLEELEEYEKRMSLSNEQIDDVLRYKGFCEIREKYVSEDSELEQSLIKANAEKKEVSKAIKEYAAKKQSVEQKYETALNNAKVKFNLAEIPSEKFKKISNNFKASGSDSDIATLIWYFTLIKLRNEFNKDAIQYPLVLDSPCNTEMDDNKRAELLNYLFDNVNLSSQVIISGIGLEKMVPDNVEAKITRLENEKYTLLSSEDYQKYESILKELCEVE